MNHKKIIILSVLLLAVAGVIAVVVGQGDRGDKGDRWYAVTTRNNVSLRIPLDYRQPLVIAVFDLALRISPVNASNARMVTEGNNIIRYLDAYPSVDVEQEKFPTKLKESLILKGPNHPDKFEYRINTEDFLWEIAPNGDILFRLKEKQNRFEMEQLSKTYAAFKVNMDNADGHPVVFRIPKPFMIEHNSSKPPLTLRGGEDVGEVEVKIENNTLTLTPDQDWLKRHRYPILLDPTIEAIPQEQEKIELGDQSAAEAKPTVRLWKWGDETYVKMGYPTEDVGSFVPEADNKITWESDGNVDVAVTMQEPDALAQGLNAAGQKVSEDGGIEFDLVVKEKPKTNVFNFELEFKGLTFNYQPPLNEEPASPKAVSCIETECRDKNGAVVSSRPEHVVGSYAVYHESKRDNYTALGGKNYKTGKVFHIYRPKVYDAGGGWVWGDLRIDAAKGSLTVTVSQDFLNRATYPITVDPTFGYTTIGESADSGDDVYLNTNPYTMPATNGIASNIKIAVWLPSGSGNVKMWIYNDDGTDAGTLLANSYPGPVAVTQTSKPTQDSHWTSGDITASLAASTKYWLAFIDDNASIQIAYDAGGVNKYAASQTYAGHPIDPAPTTNNDSGVTYSFYVTYSTNATPTITSVTDTPDPTNPNRSVTFSTDWNDADSGELVKVKVCKSSTLASQNCSDGFWASSTAFTTSDPESLVYDIAGGDAGTTRNYFVHVCDDGAACTATSTAGTFSVNAASTVPNVKFR